MQVFLYSIRAADGSQALPDLPEAEAGVDQEARLRGFEVGAIAGGTAAEDGQLNGHRSNVSARAVERATNFSSRTRLCRAETVSANSRLKFRGFAPMTSGSNHAERKSCQVIA